MVVLASFLALFIVGIFFASCWNVLVLLLDFIRMQHGTDRLFGDYFGEDMIMDEQSFRTDQEDVDINATEATQMA